MSQMKLRWMGCGFVVGAVTALGAGHAMSQDAGEMPAMPSMDQMMELHSAAVTPGSGHKKLDPLAGRWKTTTKVWWGGPGTEPLMTEGEATNRWICDGRFMLTEATGEFMMPDPSGQLKAQPTQMFSVTGYDNFRKLYVGSHISNLGTHIMNVSGSADPSGRLFTYYGELDEPMLGVIGRLVKSQLEIVDDDTHILRVYDLHVSDDYKVFEIEYQRQE
jgi:hypothetical protein